MFWMHRSIKFRQVRAIIVVLAAATISLNTAASGLSLEAAEELALTADPGVRSVEANRLALEEMSVAAEQLPDPMLKTGVLALPTDTFNLG